MKGNPENFSDEARKRAEHRRNVGFVFLAVVFVSLLYMSYTVGWHSGYFDALEENEIIKQSP